MIDQHYEFTIGFFYGITVAALLVLAYLAGRLFPIFPIVV